MKTSLRIILLWVTLIQVTFAWGSIDWVEVKSRVAKTDPKLLGIIERSFIVSPGGTGVRLGPLFGERQGERIAPYRFYAENRKTKEEVVLVIQESDDYEYSGRFKFTWEWPQKANQAEQAGGDQPATKPAGKPPVKDQPSRRRLTPGSRWQALGVSQEKYLSSMRGLLHFFIPLLFVGCAHEFNYRPKQGYVPDATTATRIAEAVWLPIYGKDTIDGERPFHAKRVGDLWYVEGSLPPGSDPRDTPVGGVAEITIHAKTGKIVRVSHGK